MYRTTLSKLTKILYDYDAKIAVAEINEHELTENDITVIEIDMEINDDDNSIEFINEFQIFTKSGLVIFGERIGWVNDFSIKFAPCSPKRIYDTLSD